MTNIPQPLECLICNNPLKSVVNTSNLISFNNSDLLGILSFCDSCKQAYWIVVNTNTQNIELCQKLQDSSKCSMWIDLDSMWFMCGNCHKITSKPFSRKTKYCPNCGNYMKNYKEIKGD